MKPFKKYLYKYLKDIREELDRRGFKGDGISGRIYEFLRIREMSWERYQKNRLKGGNNEETNDLYQD